MKKKKILLFLAILLLLIPLNVSAEMTTDEVKNMFTGSTTCGGITSFTFPSLLPNITSTVYTLLKVAVPAILIIFGMLDMFKAASSQKEDEMKKAQKKFINRLIAGACALLVFIIAETIINFIVNKTGNGNAMDCVNCFINGPDYCETITTNNTNGTNDTNDTNGTNGTDVTTNNYTCSSGYTLVNNKICIQFTEPTITSFYTGAISCPSGWTKTSDTSHCIKVESAKNNGNNVINSNTLSCSNNTCTFGNYQFNIISITYIATGKCGNGYTEVVDKNASPNNYYCVK